MESGIKNHGGEVRQFPWLEAMVTTLDDWLRLRHGVVASISSEQPSPFFFLILLEFCHFVGKGVMPAIAATTCVHASQAG
jgi:hypothetical protein